MCVRVPGYCLTLKVKLADDKHRDGDKYELIFFGIPRASKLTDSDFCVRNIYRPNDNCAH